MAGNAVPGPATALLDAPFFAVLLLVCTVCVWILGEAGHSGRPGTRRSCDSNVSLLAA